MSRVSFTCDRPKSGPEIGDELPPLIGHTISGPRFCVAAMDLKHDCTWLVRAEYVSMTNRYIYKKSVSLTDELLYIPSGMLRRLEGIMSLL